MTDITCESCGVSGEQRKEAMDLGPFIFAPGETEDGESKMFTWIEGGWYCEQCSMAQIPEMDFP